MTEPQYFVNCVVCLSVDPKGRRENQKLWDLIVQAGPGWMPSQPQIDTLVCHVSSYHGYEGLTVLPPARSHHRPRKYFRHQPYLRLPVADVDAVYMPSLLFLPQLLVNRGVRKGGLHCMSYDSTNDRCTWPDTCSTTDQLAPRPRCAATLEWFCSAGTEP